MGSDKTLTTSNIVANSGENLSLNSNLFVDTASGNVGIGVTNPGAKLSIYDGGTDANSTDTLGLDIAAPWMRIGDGFGGGKTFTNGIGIKFHDAGAAHFSIGTKDEKFKIAHTSSNGNELFPSSYTEAISIDKLGLVGIGITNPSQKLHVDGNVSATDFIGGGAAITNVNAATLGGQYHHEMSWGHDYVHGTFGDFNTFINSGYFGAHYVQGATNGPGHSGVNQYYHQRMALGSNYNNYSLQFAIPRNRNDSYLYYRNEENGGVSGWYKMRAGYSDETGTISNGGLPTTISRTTLSGSTLVQGLTVSATKEVIVTGSSNPTSGGITINNDNPTLFLQDTNHNSAMIHCNSNLLYVLRGGTNSKSWGQVNSQWPLIINLTNNDATVGGNLYVKGGYLELLYQRISSSYQTYNTGWTNIPLGATRGTFFVMVQGATNDISCAIFACTDDSGHAAGDINVVSRSSDYSNSGAYFDMRWATPNYYPQIRHTTTTRACHITVFRAA